MVYLKEGQVGCAKGMPIADIGCCRVRHTEPLLGLNLSARLGALASASSIPISALWPPLSLSNALIGAFPKDSNTTMRSYLLIRSRRSSTNLRIFHSESSSFGARTVSSGGRYDFNVRELQEAKEIPTFLLGLRETVAKFAGLPAIDSNTRS